MSDPLLTFLKYIFLAILYLFFLRVLRAVWIELREPKPAPITAGPAPAPAPGPGARTPPRPRRRSGWSWSTRRNGGVRSSRLATN